MRFMRHLLTVLVLVPAVVALAPPAAGQTPAPPASGSGAPSVEPARPQGSAPAAAPAQPASGPERQTSGQSGQAQQPPPPPPKEAQDVKYKETVVVTASRTEQQLVNAPATMTVIGPGTLNVAPSTNYGDLLRTVPGVNVTQFSARDINVTSRAATSSLSTSQLALVDGRSIYQDFFGFIMWDFMPANLNEIKQIEVIRGPASAVWGANALNGVINVITKSPREMEGTSLMFGAGGFERDVSGVAADAGALFYVSGTHAQAVNDRWAYKFSAGTYTSEALARPTGLVPNGLPNNTTTYPAFTNTGTSQPKFDARFDYDRPDNAGTFVFSGGVAATDGIMHSGIGPFDIKPGTTLSYGKVTYTKNAMRVQAFLNALDGDARNLLSIDPAGNPINFVFKTKTFDVEFGDTRTYGTKQAITYGGNLRVNRFDLTIAPGENSRTEFGAYLQDEFFLNDRYRLVAGARVDKFTSIDNAVFSPRVAFIIKPNADNTFRLSYNRAFRSPSMINNNLEVTIGTTIPLALINPAFGTAVFRVPTTATGNPDLTEERLDAFEIGYTGTVTDRTTVSVAWYYTQFTDEIFFTQTAIWGQFEPPPGFPGLGPFTPTQLWAGLYASGFIFPKSFSYLNLGRVKNKGLELGVDSSVNDHLAFNVNYSFQATPIPNFDISEINIPARHRANIGGTFNTDRTFGTFALAYVDSAFWQDVLDSRFHGRTSDYWMANLTLGTRWGGGRYSAALKATNLFNKQILQHIFGDVIRRQIVGEFRVNLPK